MKYKLNAADRAVFLEASKSGQMKISDLTSRQIKNTCSPADLNEVLTKCCAMFPRCPHRPKAEADRAQLDKSREQMTSRIQNITNLEREQMNQRADQVIMFDDAEKHLLFLAWLSGVFDTSAFGDKFRQLERQRQSRQELARYAHDNFLNVILEPGELCPYCKA